jgi:hypothetical protein
MTIHISGSRFLYREFLLQLSKFNSRLPSVAQVPAIDKLHSIVAVHGLDGHRETSWTAPNGKLWLTDFLPKLIPHARIISYGYDACTNDQTIVSDVSLRDLAMNFLVRLSLVRESTATEVCLFYDLLCYLYL